MTGHIRSHIETPKAEAGGSMAGDVLVFRNPKAGMGTGAEKVRTLCHCLSADGFAVSVIDDRDQLAEGIRCRTEQGVLRAIVAAGGDGTAELVASLSSAEVPIAVMPLGTENLLAKYLKIPADPQRVADLVAAGHSQRFDAGQANGRLFLLMASCGFDADVVSRLHRERSGPIHHLSYAKPILDAIWNYRYPALRIEFEPAGEEGRHDSREPPLNSLESSHMTNHSEPNHFGRDVLGKQGVGWASRSAYWVFVFNFPTYAAGLQIAPAAAPNDGFLTVALFRGNSFWHGLYHFSAVALGNHQSLDDFEIFTTRRLRISAENSEPMPAATDGELIPYQIDGDPGGCLPVDVRILPKRWTAVVPRSNGKNSRRS